MPSKVKSARYWYGSTTVASYSKNNPACISSRGAEKLPVFSFWAARGILSLDEKISTSSASKPKHH